jgi:hypothetical protein
MKTRIAVAAITIAAALIGVGQVAPAMARGGNTGGDDGGKSHSCASAEARARSDLRAAGGDSIGGTSGQLTNSAQSFIFMHRGAIGNTQLQGDVNQLNAYCR